MRRALRLTSAYLVVTLVMTQAMVNLGALGSAVYPGDARLVVWTLAWTNHAILDGVPFWDANIFYPAAESLQYTEHHAGVSVFALPFYAATRNPILAYNIVWILSFVLNALAMHALAFRHTRSHAAAATSALIFTFSFYKMQQAHGHLSQIWTWLVPLSVLLLERWIERPTITRIMTWAAAIVLQALATWYLAVMVVLVNGVALVWSARTMRGRWMPRVAHMMLAAVLMAAAVWPFAAKYRTLDPPPLAQVRSLSADWSAYVVPPDDTIAGRLRTANVHDNAGSIWGERTLFLGWITMALAATGAIVLLVRRDWTRAGVALTCAAIGFVLSLGPSVTGGVERTSAFGLFASIPGMIGFRVPARFALVVLFGVSLFAAEPVRLAAARLGRAAVPALLVLWPLMLVEWFVVSMPNGRPQPIEIPAIYGTPEIQSARALVSLPVYRATAQWWLEPDYMYYSTSHWRPIVNGYGRSEPPPHPHVMSYVNAFPGPNNARKMREIGVEYIVLHGAAYPDGLDDVVRAVGESDEYELVKQLGTDYLIRVRRK